MKDIFPYSEKGVRWLSHQDPKSFKKRKRKIIRYRLRATLAQAESEIAREQLERFTLKGMHAVESVLENIRALDLATCSLRQRRNVRRKLRKIIATNEEHREWAEILLKKFSTTK